jgi:hypothetical protein
MAGRLRPVWPGSVSPAVLTEFGVPMNTGVNYNGPRDGNNDVSSLYALTDTACGGTSRHYGRSECCRPRD